MKKECPWERKKYKTGLWIVSKDRFTWVAPIRKTQSYKGFTKWSAFLDTITNAIHNCEKDCKDKIYRKNEQGGEMWYRPSSQDMALAILRAMEKESKR